jgi:outer membrane protein assembly factor BamB
MGLRAVRASDGSSLWSHAPPTGRNLAANGMAGGLVFVVSRSTTIYRSGPPPGTDVNNYLLAIGADNGRLYWQMPLNLGQFAIGDAS